MFSTTLRQYAVANGCTPDFIAYHYPKEKYLHVKDGVYTLIYAR